jgi:hypothetical protein
MWFKILNMGQKVVKNMLKSYIVLNCLPQKKINLALHRATNTFLML